MKYVIGLIILALTNFANAFSYTKEFTEVELQQKVEAMMPLEKKKFFITIVITDPTMDLIESSNKLGIQAHIQAIAPGGIKGSGITNITGTISYAQAEGSFYLKDPTIVSLQINGMPDKYQKKIKSLAQASISKVLSSRPIFKFKDDSLKHKLAKAALESVVVENQKLLVKLSVF